MEEENSHRRELIFPKLCFTAFRLTYSNSKHVSESSKCILLGGIPHIWLNVSAPSVLAKSAITAKELRERFKSMLSTINQSSDEEATKSVPEIARFIKLQQQSRSNSPRNNEEILHFKSLRQKDPNKSDNTSRNKVKVEVSPPSTDNPLSSGADESLSSETSSTRCSSEFDFDKHLNILHTANDDMTNVNEDMVSPVKTYFRQELNTENESDFENNSDRESLFNKDLLDDMDDKREPEISAQESVVSEPESRAISELPNINRNSSIKYHAPNPTEYTDIPVQVDKRKYRLLKKIMSKTLNSKVKAKSKGKNVSRRLIQSFLKRFKAGEIVKMDKMLILTKIANNVNKASQFDESEPFDVRIYERWRERIVVLRKTDSIEEPLDVQFYEINNSTDEPMKEPEITFRLNHDVDANVYSKADKAVFLSIPHDDGALIHIMRCKSQISTLKWLYFLKQTLGTRLDSQFELHIPDLSLTLNLNIPDLGLLRMMDIENETKILELDIGYRVIHSALIEYIKTETISQLQSVGSEKINEWLNNVNKFWFCFRDYDRLEWVTDSSQLLLTRYNLLNRQLKLEMRDLVKNSREIHFSENASLKEPIPIEGFLARLTNISGNEISMLRTFHRISYFYSCDNILFFTKYYRAVPPLPESCKGGNMDKLLHEVPRIYEHNPFPLDQNDHITWLKSDRFDHFDNLALEEMERRSQLVIKAEAAVDLCSIKRISPIPMDQVKATHKVLLETLFYAHPGFADEEVLDSAFEIEFMNNEIMKLQAPNRVIREHWMAGLSTISYYWKHRRTFESKIRIELRERNAKKLNINEYGDSNVLMETDPIEVSRAFSDTFLYNIDGIAMTKCVIYSGYLFQKQKKHSNFNQYFVVLCPGFIILFSMFKRSKKSGRRKKVGSYEHYLTIPLSNCYLYSGVLTSSDLLERSTNHHHTPGKNYVPRLYPDGWKSSEEESMRCFTLWFGSKRKLVKSDFFEAKEEKSGDKKKSSIEKNPGIMKMAKRLGVTGSSIFFMARSRQEREIWTDKIYCELDRCVG